MSGMLLPKTIKIWSSFFKSQSILLGMLTFFAQFNAYFVHSIFLRQCTSTRFSRVSLTSLLLSAISLATANDNRQHVRYIYSSKSLYIDMLPRDKFGKITVKNKRMKSKSKLEWTCKHKQINIYHVIT